MSFQEALTIALIVLRLCNVINWPWGWVLSPLWISWIIGAFFGLIFGDEQDNEK